LPTGKSDSFRSGQGLSEVFNSVAQGSQNPAYGADDGNLRYSPLRVKSPGRRSPLEYDRLQTLKTYKEGESQDGGHR